MFQGKLEVIVNLSNFRNIDLYEQGFYALRVQIDAQSQQNVQPYTIFENKQNHKFEAQILDDKFYSSIFEIQYSDQNVILDDVCVFRINYIAHPIRNTGLTLKISLLYSQLLDYNEDPIQNYQQMQSVSVYEFILRNACDGVNITQNIVFDTQHLCAVKLYLHTISFDFKYSGASFDQFFSKITNERNYLILVVDNDAVNQFIVEYVDSLQTVSSLYKSILLQAINQAPQDRRSVYLKQLIAVPQTQQQQFRQQTNENTIAVETLLMINKFGADIFTLWLLFQEVYQVFRECLLTDIDQKAIAYTKRSADDFVISQEQQELLNIDANILKSRDQTIKQKEYQIEDGNYLNIQRMPFGYEDVFNRKVAHEQSKRHLIVLVHGYQGSSLDLQAWRNMLHLKFPQHCLLISTSNEDDTEGDIKQMAQNLAVEVNRQINDRIQIKSAFHLSFIGHSLGGVIIRAALPLLSKYQEHMHTFISLASPHLGLGAQQSTLVGTGLWFMKQFKAKDSRTCLDQMTLADQPCVIQTIANNDHLHFFKNIILAYSPQDLYVPFQSASMSIINNSNSDRAQLHNSMLKEILKRFTQQTVIKFGVTFPVAKTNLDSMIGRTAHIEFLDNMNFIRLFIDYFGNYIA